MKLAIFPQRISQARLLRGLRRGVQVVSLAAFLVLFVLAATPGLDPALASVFYRLDPLVALTATLAGRGLVAGMGLALVTLLLTVIFGRAWCGWLCPLGTVLDVFSPRTAKGKRRRQSAAPPAERWRLAKYALLAFLIIAALFGNQTFLFLDPITILTRTLTQAVWPALAYAVGQVEAFLYQFEVLWGPLDVVHEGLIYPIFKDAVGIYSLAMPVFFFFLGLVGLNWVAERFWCRYLCPLGGLLGLVSRLALFKRAVTNECTSCALCSHHCPTGTINPQKGFTSDPAECTMCLDCLDACPREGVVFRPAVKPAMAQSYDPGRREALAAFGAAATWAALAGVEPIRQRQPAMMVRPPGATQVAFEALCIRCNACLRACPTHGLQGSLLEGGWQNVLTPRLDARLGACAYNCNACGQVCPTGAIPRLTLEEKRVTPIGLARVDRTRCLPWNYNIECIVCEETCPLPEKAIRLEVVETTNAEGQPVTMQRPYVIKELCIGCGMCEFKCPMGGEAAIRVFAPTETGGFFTPT